MVGNLVLHSYWNEYTLKLMVISLLRSECNSRNALNYRPVLASELMLVKIHAHSREYGYLLNLISVS